MSEHHHTDDSVLSEVSITSLQGDGGVASSTVDDTSGQDGSHSGKDIVIVAFVNALFEDLLNSFDLRLLDFSHLNKYESKSNHGSLLYEINLIVSERSE